MDDLIAFVRARLDEDENWLVPWADGVERKRREVAAKRRRLERYLHQDGYYLPKGVNDGRDPDEQECDEARKFVLEGEVQEDAAIWSDHPDYRAEWKP